MCACPASALLGFSESVRRHPVHRVLSKGAELTEGVVFDESRAVRLLNKECPLVDHVDAANARVRPWAFLRTSYTSEIYAEPVVVRTAVRTHPQAVVIEVDAAEFGEPFPDFADG